MRAATFIRRLTSGAGCAAAPQAVGQHQGSCGFLRVGRRSPETRASGRGGGLLGVLPLASSTRFSLPTASEENSRIVVGGVDLMASARTARARLSGDGSPMPDAIDICQSESQPTVR